MDVAERDRVLADARRFGTLEAVMAELKYQDEHPEMVRPVTTPMRQLRKQIRSQAKAGQSPADIVSGIRSVDIPVACDAFGCRSLNGLLRAISEDTRASAALARGVPMVKHDPLYSEVSCGTSAGLPSLGKRR
jgi:hypothetical protein